MAGYTLFMEVTFCLFEFKTLEFFLHFKLNSANSVTKMFVITVKGLEPGTQPSLLLETMMLPQHQKYTCERQDLIEFRKFLLHELMML